MSEDPKTVYGRLLESAHISGYSFERCCTELGLLLEGDNWQKVASHADVNEFLRSIDLSAFNLGDKRPQLVKRIKELQPQATQRAIAQAVRVSKTTVQMDLGGQKRPPQAKDPAPQLGSSDEAGQKKTTPSSWLSAGASEIAAFAERVEKKLDREDRRAALAEKIRKEIVAPTAKYHVLYADPPWDYAYHPSNARLAVDHYPAMSMADLCALPVSAWCEPNAVLFLWVTSPLLEECFPVIAAWGFSYKASFVWDKMKHNVGYYNSVRHEFLLICTRGSGVPQVKKLFDSVITAERTTHSTKPPEVYEIIEALYPSGKRLELFARRRRDGWDAYGYEADV